MFASFVVSSRRRRSKLRNHAMEPWHFYTFAGKGLTLLVTSAEAAVAKPAAAVTSGLETTGVGCWPICKAILLLQQGPRLGRGMSIPVVKMINGIIV